MATQQEVTGVHDFILGIKPRTVLVKVFGMRIIPDVIPEKVRDARDLEQKHAEEGKKLGIADGGIGAWRETQVDTGYALHRNAQDVKAGELLRDLNSQGYELTDAHWYWHEKGGTRRKVLVLNFSLNALPIEMAQHIREVLIARLRGFTFKRLDVWANPKWAGEGEQPFRLDTVNFAGPSDDSVVRAKSLRFTGTGYPLE